MAKRNDKAKCSAKTKKGKPCQAYALKVGTEIDGHPVKGGYCRAHDPLLPAEVRLGGKAQAAAAGAKGGAAGRQPRVVDIMRERIEAEMEEVLAPFFQEMRHASFKIAVPTVVDPETGAVLEHDFQEIPDYERRMRAAERLLDRSYGKPAQAINLGGSETPIHMEVTGAAIIGDPDARRHAEQLRRRVGSSRAQQRGRARTSD